MPITSPKIRTNWFDLLVRKNMVNSDYELNPFQLATHITNNTIDYNTLAELLHEANDAQFNIVWQYNSSTNTWLQDHTNAISANEGSNNSPVIAANNTLLRCLPFVIQLNQLIDERYQNNHKRRDEIKQEIRAKFALFSTTILSTAQSNEENEQDKLATINEGERTFKSLIFDSENWLDFLTIRNKDQTELWLDPQQIQTHITSQMLDYQTLSDLLRATNDAQFGIVSTYDVETNAWVRNATASIPLDKRITTHNSPIIEVNNALLRCLSRLQPIEYAIQKKHGPTSELATQLTDDIRTEFAKLAKELLTISRSAKNDKEKLKAFKTFEKQFNTQLIATLHKANLTQGCLNAADAKKLLLHYRNLSSLLMPARTLVTLTYDPTDRVLTRETQYPVTQKTAKQKEAIQEIAHPLVYPLNEDKTAHTIHNLATQEADSLFAELLQTDETLLPAQTRTTHLASVKNAFIVKTELIQMSLADIPERGLSQEPARTEDVLWLARAGSPVYVGKGETDSCLLEHTIENIEQIRQEAQKQMGKDNLAVHVMTLNTDTFYKRDDVIVKCVGDAVKQNATRQQKATLPKDTFSHIPMNLYGTCFNAAPTPSIENPPPDSASGQKADRLKFASSVFLSQRNTRDTINLVHCASGQDRTGTLVEKTTQQWMTTWYEQNRFDKTNIEATRAMGGNAAEIASHLVIGSPGMKAESKADNVFGAKKTFRPRTSQELYRDSAETNKKNKIGDVSFLTTPSDELKNEYKKKLIKLQQLIVENRAENPVDQTLNQKIVDAVTQVMNHVTAIGGETGENLDASALSDLNLTLSTCIQVLNPSQNAPQYLKNTNQIAALSQRMANKTSSPWRKLGNALLLVAAAASIFLIVTGIIAAIPSGGASLFISAAGAASLSVASTIAIGVGATVTTGVVGFGFRFFSDGKEKEKQLAHSLTDLKQTLENTAPTTVSEEREVARVGDQQQSTLTA